MSFNFFSFFRSGGHFHVQGSKTILAILVEGHPSNFSVNLFFETKPLVWEEMSFKVVVFFLYFMLWWRICSAEWNNFNNFGRGSPKEHFCEIILKSFLWSRRGYLLKVFLFLALVAILCSRTI